MLMMVYLFLGTYTKTFFVFRNSWISGESDVRSAGLICGLIE